MIEKKNSFVYEEYNDVDACSPEIKELFKIAIEAKNKAYAPYSNFKVGAAILLDNGEIFIGNNQENAAYPSGLCAERVAIFSAKAQYPNASIKSLVIVSSAKNITEPIAPCGSCRQVLAEYEFSQEEPFDIYLETGDARIIRILSAQSLLPFSFHSKMLNA
ncbi:MAG: cytidine deaminase [Weeksellaceae bacterium]